MKRVHSPPSTPSTNVTSEAVVNKQTLEDVLYIIEAFERGCFAEDYWMEIASIKTKLNTLMKELPNDPV
jgi:hypothetical protein